jgi:hypothetical protein
MCGDDELVRQIEQLGEVVAEHRLPPWQTRIAALFGACLGVLGVAFLYGSLSAFGRGEKVPFQVVMIGVLGLLACIALIHGALRTRGLRVIVCRGGLILAVRTGIEVLPWADVAELRSSTKVLRIAQPYYLGIGFAALTIRGADGRQWTVPVGLARIRKLIEAVQTSTLPILLERTLAAIHRGESVSFGYLSLSAEGIHCGESVLPWGEFRMLQHQEDGVVRVLRRDSSKPFCQCDDVKLANLHVLSVVIQRSRAPVLPPP